MTASPDAFAVKDCALIAIATGARARTLAELRDHLRTIHVESIYNHFWGGLLSPRFEEREFNNDFASWVRHGIHDGRLAEQMAMIDPGRFGDLEELRRELIDSVEERLDENEALYWTRATEPFDFIRSQIVVFDTGQTIERPEDLPATIATLSPGSLFFHFIDARRRSPAGIDDFGEWLAKRGPACVEAARRLAGVDPWFGSLEELRSKLTLVLRGAFPETPP